MELPIKPQRRDAIHAQPGLPLALLDDASNERFFLLPESEYRRLQDLANESVERRRRQLKELIEEGVNSPAVPVEDAIARIRGRLAQIAAER
jgi:hypothetical protein